MGTKQWEGRWSEGIGTEQGRWIQGKVPSERRGSRIEGGGGVRSKGRQIELRERRIKGEKN